MTTDVSVTHAIYCTECKSVSEHTVADERAVDGMDFIRTTCERCSFSTTWGGEIEPGLPRLLDVLMQIARDWERAGV